MTDKLDIPKLMEVARAAQYAEDRRAEWARKYPDGVTRPGTAEREFQSALTPAVAVALCERVRELEKELHEVWRDIRIARENGENFDE